MQVSPSFQEIPAQAGAPHILVVSHDVVGAHMAGPGIRYYQLARVLSREFTVTLAVPHPPAEALATPRLRLAGYVRGQWPTLQPLLEGASALLVNCVSLGDFPELAGLQIPLIVDGYDPLLAEWLAMTQDRPLEQEAAWGEQLRRLRLPYQAGDFFLCASERQRDEWLGLLEASGRINPWTQRSDPSFRKLVDVVPFGMPHDPPVHTHPLVRGVWPGISADDKILLWGGGLWPWMDPITAILAAALVWQQRPEVRLIFPGTRHPNPVMEAAPTHLEVARQTADHLGLLDRVVYFGDWVAYPDWPNVLLESDLALSLHFAETLETRWAFRTRVLDYIWAGLPMIVTGGDATSELVQNYGLGSVVASREVDEVAAAILKWLDVPRPSLEERFESAHQALTWEETARPLLAFCRQPHLAADKGGPATPGDSPEMLRLKEDNRRLQALVAAYEQRKIVRLLNWLGQVLKGG